MSKDELIKRSTTASRHERWVTAKRTMAAEAVGRSKRGFWPCILPVDAEQRCVQAKGEAGTAIRGPSEEPTVEERKTQEQGYRQGREPRHR